MESVDDRTFRVNFVGDGLIKLRESVKNKLQEFMGDYTDDTLVEYVIVLLKNGRHKNEAMNELNVFLSDDSHSFVTWLWNHLSCNLDLYTCPLNVSEDKIEKPESTVGVINVDHKSHHVALESHKRKFDKLSVDEHKSNQTILGSVVTIPTCIRNNEIVNYSLENAHQKASHKISAHPSAARQIKRCRDEERQHSKRETISRATIDAPRRILQFAMRDAVGTCKPDVMAKGPSLKRLQSVVSTPIDDTLFSVGCRRIQSVTRARNPVSSVIRAVEEEESGDVTKVKSAGSVFDRLGRCVDVRDTSVLNVHRRDVSGTENKFDGQVRSNFLQSSMHKDINVIESEASSANDLISDNDGSDKVNVMGHSILDTSQTGISHASKDEGSLMLQYSVRKDADDAEVTQEPEQGWLVSPAPTSSRKIVNISVNVNTWKPPLYPDVRNVAETKNQKSIQHDEARDWICNAQLMKENAKSAPTKSGSVVLTDAQQTLPPMPSSYNFGHSMDDVDSRVIFISNVHFAATKESLSQHFNRFGEVLKVIIVSDAKTGKPKGSAYVEFMQKEAAVDALSLDGTSFLSRILKVVVKRRSARAPQEATVTGRPHVSRAMPCSGAWFARSLPRCFSSTFRARLPAKAPPVPQFRRFQWKRDGVAVSPTSRNLTYVRPSLNPTYVRPSLNPAS